MESSSGLAEGAQDRGALHRWRRHAFAPIVLALADSGVRDACKANGLTLAQLLRPFERIDGIDCVQFHCSTDMFSFASTFVIGRILAFASVSIATAVPIRTSSESSVHLTDFQVRIRSTEECEPVQPERIEPHLYDVLQPWSERACAFSYSPYSAPSLGDVQSRSFLPFWPGIAVSCTLLHLLGLSCL